MTINIIRLLLPRRFKQEKTNTLARFVRLLCNDPKYLYQLQVVNYALQSMYSPLKKRNITC